MHCWERGIPGDRGWAIRDETTGEITNGKHFPPLMQCSARYRESPANGFIPHVEMHFPDGRVLGSDLQDINARLTALLDKPVSLWPLQPASNTEHYRRSSKTARLFGKLARFRPFRAVLPALTSFGHANAELREAFSREPASPFRIFRRCRRKSLSSLRHGNLFRCISDSRADHRVARDDVAFESCELRGTCVAFVRTF